MSDRNVNVTLSLYRLDDGRFTGRQKRIPQRLLRTLAAPEGHAWIEGACDPATQRVDLATGVLVAYQRPAAEIEGEQQKADARRARQRIAALELAQLRPMRELAMDPNNAEAKRRLAEIDGEVGTLRQALK